MGTIDQLLQLLEIWCDLKMNNKMFRKDLLKELSSSHLLHYGSYLDYPKDNIPSSKILFRNKNELDF
jgi:hypothetical protein